MRRNIHVALGENARGLGTLRFDAQGARENAAFEYDTTWLAAPPPPVIASAGAGVAKEATDAVFVTAPLVRPSYPPGEVSAVVPDGQARDPEIFARV